MRTETASVAMKTKTERKQINFISFCEMNSLKFAGNSTFEKNDIPFWSWWLAMLFNSILPVQLILPSPLNPPLQVQL